MSHFADKRAFKAYLAPLWATDWFGYAKRPFAGPEQVLAYLSRYTHRVAISNSRLIFADQSGVTFTYKDYRIDGPERYTTMTLDPDELMRRFLMHVLPKGFHRIRHYGLLTNDDQLEVGGLLHRQVTGLCALQDAVSFRDGFRTPPGSHRACCKLSGGAGIRIPSHPKLMA